MTLDEAIEHARQVSIDKADESLNCDNECAREHWQLAEWLIELKLLRDAHEDVLHENAKLRKLIAEWYPHMKKRVGVDALWQWGHMAVIRELGVEEGE